MYIGDFIAIFLIVIVFFKLNWFEVLKNHFTLLFLTGFTVLSSAISSFLINKTTSYLFFPGFSQSVLPLIILLFLFLLNEKQKVELKPRDLYFLLVIQTLNTIVQFFINEPLSGQLALGFLNSFILLYFIHVKFPVKFNRINLFIGIFLLTLSVVYSPYTLPYTLLMLVFLYLKEKTHLNIRKPILTVLFIVSIAILIVSSFANNYNDKSFEILNQYSEVFRDNTQRLFFGYGLGNLGDSSHVRIGFNQELYYQRPIVQELLGVTLAKDIQPWFLQTLFSGGFLYFFGIITLFICYLNYKKRKDLVYTLILFALCLGLLTDVFGSKNSTLIFVAIISLL
ncbi:MAG: hypothetical protein ACRCXZ_02035 [Patescibacteria group bacterium]